MGIDQKQIRLQQKEQFEKKLAARKAQLVEQGFDAAGVRKDKVVKHLEAELKRTVAALKSIDKQVAIVAGARTKKEENARAKAEAGPKKKKKAESEPQKKESKKKKKKEE